jgi:serine/threonine-protein kinase
MIDPIVARWADAERVLDEVLDLPDGEQAAAARARCGDDAVLLSVVLRLLEAGHTDVVPVAAAFVAEALDAGEDDGGTAPAMVGPFRILRELGRGGMGRVFLGIRDGLDGAPRVAVKVLDRPMAGSDVRRRFDRERETLARLEHPHIARLQDGGVTADGTPYLVMEFVEGDPIDRHCAARALDVPARLELMRQVCEAVEYAHGRLVVHRDLKPANVMVDRHGQVKLLDFGIAKWLDDLEAESPLTLTAERVLTPAHAAPEQFTGDAVTAATDVYQLGLLLYTVLTGHRAHRVEGATTAAVRRAVCEVDPVPPSRAVADAAVPSAPRALSRRLEGDLDAIVLKALRKDPRERYGTVEALRRDLDNHLANRPVSAHDGTRLYALRKYVRRHPVPVAAAAGVLLASVVGMAAVAWQAGETAAERDRAVAAEAAAEAVNAFLVNELLAAPTPERARGREVTVAEVLDNASRSVGVALQRSPGIQAQVRQALARSYLALGKYDQADTHAAEAHRLVAAGRPADDPDVLVARRLLVDVALARGAAAPLADEARAIAAALDRRRGAADDETLLAAATYGRVLDARDELAAAEAVLQAADQRAWDDPDVSPDTQSAVRAAYVETLIARGRARQAEPLARTHLARLTERYGTTDPHLVPAGRQLARALTETLEYERAVEVTEAQVRLHEALYGPDHPETARAVNDLAVAYDRATRDQQALAASERALAIRQRALGPDHPDTLMSMRNVAISLRRSGRPAEALPLYRTVAAGYARSLGELHPRALASADEVGNALLDLGRVAETRELRRAVAARYERAIAAPAADPSLLDDYALFLIETEPDDLRSPAKAVAVATRAAGVTGHADFGVLRTLARAYEAAGDPRRALDTAVQAEAMPAGLQSFVTEGMVVRLMRTLDPERLEPWLLQRRERIARERGPDDYLITLTLDQLAQHAVRQNRPGDAEARLREKLDVLGRAVPPTHFQVALTRSDLGNLLLARGALAEAEPLLVAGFEGAVTSRRPTTARREEVRARLVRLYEALGRPAEAAKYRAYVLPSFTDR